MKVWIRSFTNYMLFTRTCDNRPHYIIYTIYMYGWMDGWIHTHTHNFKQSLVLCLLFHSFVHDCSFIHSVWFDCVVKKSGNARHCVAVIHSFIRSFTLCSFLHSTFKPIGMCVYVCRALCMKTFSFRLRVFFSLSQLKPVWLRISMALWICF